MRTVDSSHRWDYGAMQCTKCFCSTNDNAALVACAFAPPAVKTAEPKMPDLFQTSMPADDAPPTKK